MGTNKTWLVHLENPYQFKDGWTCDACREHVEHAKKYNMLLLVDESDGVQGVTFNHVEILKS